MNQFGRNLRLSIFGESHGPGVGIVVDGLPPGTPVDLKGLQRDLDARRPGHSRLVSQRNEPDFPAILSGVHEAKATGTPLAVWIANQDAQSAAYARQGQVPRPGHADWVNHVWSGGFADPRGGGHSSGRLTAGLVAAASLASPVLQSNGIRVAAHLHAVGTVVGPQATVPLQAMLEANHASPVKTAHQGMAEAFVERIEQARREGDSVGGIVEFACEGMAVGVGEPFFDSIESLAAHLLFAIPAVKGVEFGAGFAGAAMTGRQHNDPYTVDASGRIHPATNHAGGILGGRATGERISGRVAIKPASSIFQPQESVDLATGKPARLEITGRHDPCIAVRAVPVVQACMSLVVADLLLGQAAQAAKAR